MDPADRAVRGEPALAWGIYPSVTLQALRPSHPLEDHPTQAATNQISGSGGFHTPILRPPPANHRGRLHHGSKQNNAVLICLLCGHLAGSCGLPSTAM